MNQPQVIFSENYLDIIRNSSYAINCNQNWHPQDYTDKSFQGKNEKSIKLLKKPQSILKKLRMEYPLTYNHVYNVFNIIGINEESLKNKNFEESFYKTMFYIKVVERVQMRKYAIVLHLKPLQNTCYCIEYLINRYKSFGTNEFYQMACLLELIAAKIKRETFTEKLMKSFDGQPLSRFIDSMHDQMYICEAAPNKLVISRCLLQLIGQDTENYAIEMCKYKMPLREIISSESYFSIISQYLQNMSLVCDFIDGKLTPDELHQQTFLKFSDYLYNKHHKKIYCDFVLFMPTPQMTCIQLSQIRSTSEEVKQICLKSKMHAEKLRYVCEQKQYNEAQVLKSIMRVPEGLLKMNKKKIAGYKTLQNYK